MKFDDYLATLPNSAAEKGFEFEREIEHWLKTDTKWSKIFVRVTPWGKWEKAKTRDIGIDLVAEDLHGHFWAIQVKARPKSQTISKSEIDSFLAASSTSLFRERLLIATADELGPNARATVLEQEKPVRLLLNQDLREADFEWGVRETGTSHPKSTSIKKPKTYQQKIIGDAVKGFSVENRLLLQMACGTGKTFTALRISEAIGAKLIVLAVPSITLLSQAITDWLSDSSKSFNWLAVCSDSSVDKTEDGEYLADFSFPATTDVEEISQVLLSEGKRVIFSTYQSLQKVEIAIRNSGLEADLLIADEAHRLAGNPSETLRKLFDEAANLSKKILFLTATPKIFKQNSSDTEDSQSIISMDDPTIFGRAITPYTFSQAIEENELTDFSVEIIGVSSREVQELITAGVHVDLQGVSANIESVAVAVGTLRAIRKRNLTRIISFHSRVSKAKNFTKILPLVRSLMSEREKQDLDVIANWLSGQTPANKRKQLISELKKGTTKKPQLLANARCLTEGVNVPSLDGVVFVDPRTSEVDIIQAVGRAIRKSTGKSEGVIVLPVLVGETKEDVDKDLQRSSYKAIWAVLNALKSHDPAFGEELDQIRETINSTNINERSTRRLHWNLPINVDPQILNAIQVRTIKLSSNAWFERYSYLVDYKAEFGHANPDQAASYGGFSWLGAWVSQQRSKWTSGILSHAQIEKLDSIGVVRDVLEYTWNLNYETLKNYVKKFGVEIPQVLWSTCLPNKLGIDQLNIGQWLSVQTQAYRDGKLEQSRTRKLEELGISWKKIDTRWEKDLEAYIRFREKFNRWPRSSDSPSGPAGKTHSWGQNFLMNLRRAARGELAQNKIEDLKRIGAPIGDQAELLWDSAFEDLKEFFETHHHSDVPNDLIGTRSGLQMKSWIYTQRSKRKEGTLSSTKIKKLDSISFRWLTGDPNRDNLKNVAWWDCYEVARKYFEENGLNAEIPGELKTPDGRAVAAWTNRQRFRKRQNLLKDWQITAMEEFGFIWDPRKKST